MLRYMLCVCAHVRVCVGWTDGSEWADGCMCPWHHSFTSPNTCTHTQACMLTHTHTKEWHTINTTNNLMLSSNQICCLLPPEQNCVRVRVYVICRLSRCTRAISYYTWLNFYQFAVQEEFFHYTKQRGQWHNTQRSHDYHQWNRVKTFSLTRIFKTSLQKNEIKENDNIC